MADFDQAVLDFINKHNLIGIKAGKNRDTFLQIWMVVVDRRVLARSWGLKERSWFNSFLQDPHGQIQCGDRTVAIKARVQEGDEELQERISQAYLRKYDKGENSFYEHGIIRPEHVAKTMEFLPFGE
ncbi:DUF2255 family protein [Pontibacter toksunensis]|uniref:DUF2255 family protein n=1 Tax=Pontibacter toksunensis TaxID=1332631 RepID=A0ABW6BXE7_9BACT